MPTLNLSGGLRVVSIYADLLSKKGHQVTVVTPNRKRPNIKEKIKAAMRWKGYRFQSGFDQSFFNNLTYKLIVLDSHRPVLPRDVPDADLVIATFWNTAEWVAEFPDVKGRKVYFIQHYEVHPWLPVEKVEATLRLPFKRIVVSNWIARVLHEKYNLKDITVVGNGVDQQQFFSAKRDRNKCFTVGVMYADELSFKGCDTSIASVLKARETIPELKLISFAKHLPVPSLPLPDNTTFYLQPKQEEIRNIYSQCDAWLFGSRNEGFGLPILEAMACRTPVIGTKAGAAPELLEGGAGVLVEIDDVDAMAKAIVDLYSMSANEWIELSDKAYSVALQNSWQVKVSEFERELVGICNVP